MNKLFSIFFLLVGAPVITQAQESMTGVLELLWSDPLPQAVNQTTQFHVTLVSAQGARYLLDTDAALHATENLYSLIGQRVTVEIDTSAARSSINLPIKTITLALEDTAETTFSTTAVVGSQPWVFILCKFSDKPNIPETVDYFEEMFSSASGRLDHFWREVSYNKINLSNSHAYDWVMLPHPRSFYFFPNGSANLTALFTDCTNAADAVVDYSAFSGINLVFNSQLDELAWGGNRLATLDGATKSWPVTWLSSAGTSAITVVAHEMGHGFGLPHANNSDQDNDAYDNPWDLLSNNLRFLTADPIYGGEPKHINVYHRDQLGWIDPARKLTLAQDGYYANLMLDRASLLNSTNLQMIVVRLPGTPTTHYYTIETRKKTGVYEADLPGDAIIIHEVDQTRLEPAWSVDAEAPPADISSNLGSMFMVGETYVAPGNAFTVFISAVTADGFILNIRRGSDVIFINNFE